jgi:hypothetical protein
MHYFWCIYFRQAPDRPHAFRRRAFFLPWQQPADRLRLPVLQLEGGRPHGAAARGGQTAPHFPRFRLPDDPIDRMTRRNLRLAT